MTSTFTELSEDKLNTAISALIAPGLERLFQTRGKGHCMRVMDLEQNVMESLCKELHRSMPDAQIFILATHSEQSLPYRITSTKLVELRNSDNLGDLRPPLLVFIPSSLRTSAEDSFGIATFEDISFQHIYDDLVDALLDRMPAGLASLVRDTFGILQEQRWPFDNNIARARYLLTALENGIDGETLGASLYELTLVPDFRLFAEPTSIIAKVRRNMSSLQSLTNSHKSVRGRITDLGLTEQGLQSRLTSFFDRYDIQDPEVWTKAIATEKSWWNISFDKWLFREELWLDKVRIDVQQTDLPTVKPDESDVQLRDLVGQQVLIPNERRKLNVIFEVSPHPGKVNGLDHFTVQIVSEETGPIGKSKSVKIWSAARTTCTASITKLDKIEFEAGWHFLRILPWTADGDPVPIESSNKQGTARKQYESEPFYVLPGGTLSEEQPQRATPIEISVAHAQIRFQLTALNEERDPDDVTVTAVAWSDEAKQKRTNKQETLLAKFDQFGTVQIPVSRALKSIEQRILSEPKHPSGWRMQININDAESPVKVGLYLPTTPSVQAFLAAREGYFQQIRQGQLELTTQGLSIADAKQQCINYASAYLELLQELTTQSRQEQGSNNKTIQSLRIVLAVDSIHVVITDFRGRHKEAAIVSPTHPLRALWYLCWSELANHWISELTTASREYIPLIRATLLKELAPSAFPVGVPTEDSRVFVHVDDLNSLWGLYAPTTEDNSRTLTDQICYSLGLSDSAKTTSVISGSVVADKIQRYLSQHPYVRELSVNVFNPGSGVILVDALTELQSKSEYADLRYDIRLFSSEPDSPILGESLISLLFPWSGSKEVEDAFSRVSGNHLFSKLVLAKHSLADFHNSPSSYSAHISILLDVFPAEELSVINQSSQTMPLNGLIQDFETQFVDDDSGTYWNRSPIVGMANSKSPTPFQVLSKLSTQISHATASVSTCGSTVDSVPMITLGLTLSQRELIYQIHRISDWVFTLDRNMGIEFFDHGGLKSRPDYLIDYVPASNANSTHNLIISSRSNDELAGMLTPLLKGQGITISTHQAVQILASLRSLSGQLALKLISAPSQQTEALGLALARLYLEYQGALSNQIIVPLDAHTDLYRSPTDADDVEAALSLRRTDLALFDLNLAARTITCNLVEVKCYTQLSDFTSFTQLKERIAGQINESERILQKHFDRGAKKPDRPDRLLKDRQLSTLLRFYLDRSSRYGIFEKTAAQEALVMLQSIYDGYSLEFRRSALIFDFEKTGTESPEKQAGIEYHRIGKDIIEALLSGCEQRPEQADEPAARVSLSEQLLPSVPKLDSAAFIAPNRSRTTEWTRGDDDSTGGSPVPSPSGRPPDEPDTPSAPRKKRPKPISSPLSYKTPDQKSPAVAEPSANENELNRVEHAPTAEHAKKYANLQKQSFDAVLGVSTTTPQFGILGEMSGRTIALDLNHTHTISLFGVQGGGKSYTLGSIIEMACMPIDNLNLLPSPLATVIFHYSPTQDYAPEFTSMKSANDVGQEIDLLRERYGATPKALDDILILTSQDKVEQRISEYPGIQVHPIAFSASELKAAHWKFLMGAVGSQSMYMKQINLIMRSLRNNLTLGAIKEGIEESGLSDHLKELALTRLNFASEYITEKQRLQDLIRPGRLIIVDLRDEYIEKDEALGLFIVMLQIFSESTFQGSKFNKLVVFDEAHKYIENDELVAGLIEVVREMRHKGTSIMVASQDPPSVPVALIELSTQIILNKFNSPAWLKHIQKANAALGDLTSEKMSELRTGEAFVWSSKASDNAFTRSAVRIKCRPRVTKHGGATKTAVNPARQE